MNRIIFVYSPTTGDWIIKNDFTNSSVAREFVEDNPKYAGYRVAELVSYGGHWSKIRQGVQYIANREAIAAQETARVAAMTVPEPSNTAASREAIAELGKTKSKS